MGTATATLLKLLLCSDFAVQSASEFNDLQQNSLRKGTGNFLKVSGKIFWVIYNREFSRQSSESDPGPIF
jgi:hypothetical protein